MGALSDDPAVMAGNPLAALHAAAVCSKKIVAIGTAPAVLPLVGAFVALFAAQLPVSGPACPGRPTCCGPQSGPFSQYGGLLLTILRA